jgi:ribosomal protein S27AE
MGKMKELFIEQQDELMYRGSQDPRIVQYFQQSIEEFIKVDNTPCPNCNQPTLLRNESDAHCERCGQDFVYIGEGLRFK